MQNSEIFIDFASAANTYRRLHGGGNGQPLARAIGLKTYGLPLVVIDATAGLGQDSFVLASLGCHVTMIERLQVY
jgi:16S rRNA (guanine1516-N2)-methyltransferase